MYLYLLDSSQKESELRKILAKYHSKKVILVVPKAYYSQIIWEVGLQEIMDVSENLTITTANRFRNSLICDVIISVGDISGKRFNIFWCNTAQKILCCYMELKRKCLKQDKKEQSNMNDC